MKLLILGLTLLIACGTISLAPTEMRKKEFTIENKNSKDENFNKLQLWASKGGQVRLNDRQSGNIVLKANIPCDAVPMGNGYAHDGRVWFLLELKAGNKQVKANFSDIQLTTIQGWDSNLRPSSKAEADKVISECINPIKETILLSLEN